MDDAFGFAGRAGGVEDVERVLGIDRFGIAVGFDCGQQFVEINLMRAQSRPSCPRWNQTTWRSGRSSTACSTMLRRSTPLPRRMPMLPAITSLAPASRMRSRSAPTPMPA
jgi:hypothetical protein